MPICLKCNKDFKPGIGSTGKFCSRTCSVSYWNHKKPKRKRTARLYNCLGCGILLNKDSQKVYCSNKCQSEKYRNEVIERFHQGEDCSDKSGNLTGVIRRYLITNIAKNKCPKCGWSVQNPYIKKVILTIEHKDGNGYNNTEKNIEVMCFNCHTLTPTFGILNKGHGVRYTPRMKENDIKARLTQG